MYETIKAAGADLSIRNAVILYMLHCTLIGYLVSIVAYFQDGLTPLDVTSESKSSILCSLITQRIFHVCCACSSS